MPTIAFENKQDLLRQLRHALDLSNPPEGGGRLPIYEGEGEDGISLGPSPGEVFIRSKSYKDWLARFADGGPSTPMNASADPVRTGGMRSLITTADASAGTLVRPDYLGLLEPGLVRPLTIRSLLTVIPTTTDSVEYVKEASRVSGAAAVAEATALTGASGLKPEGGLAFQVVTEVVRTIAEWVPCTTRILKDAPRLRAYVDEYLGQDIGLEIEDLVISGNGSGENFRGILNTPGIGSLGPPAGSLNAMDIIRSAIRTVRLSGRTQPNGVAAHPQDVETMQTLKASGSGEYFGGGPFNGFSIPTIWGVPLVETDAIPPGFALVGDFRKAVLFDREQLTISVGTVADDFVRNIVRLLGEVRAAFGVVRPSAFVYCDLLP